MDFLAGVLVAAGLLYILLALLIHIGLTRRWPQTGERPQVTVLVAARNEAGSLPSCLDHLAGQSYPPEKTQILIINDRSTDDTAAIARSYSRRYRSMALFEIQADKNGLHGKMNAIAQAMAPARGEIILITDADCRPDAGWITETVSYFTPDTGMVGGLTLLSGDGIFQKIQACDWLFLQAVASGSAGLGYPVSILGNNFAFRKKVYEAIGGYEAIGFSLTEDMALLQAIRHQTPFGIAYPVSAGSLVQSSPADSFTALFHQRLRWIAGGRRSDAGGRIMMLAAFILHLLLPPVLLFYPETALIWPVAGMVILIDFLLLFRLSGRAAARRLLWLFPFFESYYLLYTTIFGFLSLLPVKIRWKDRTYQAGAPKTR